MSVEHFVDAGRAVVFSFCWGEVSLDELVSGLAKLRDHPQFGADYRQLVDLFQCSTTELDFNDLCGIHLADDPFSNEARRAIVAPRGGAAFGLARMYQSIVDNSQLEVFDSLAAAVSWLNLEPSVAGKGGPLLVPPDKIPRVYRRLWSQLRLAGSTASH